MEHQFFCRIFAMVKKCPAKAAEEAAIPNLIIPTVTESCFCRWFFQTPVLENYLEFFINAH